MVPRPRASTNRATTRTAALLHTLLRDISSKATTTQTSSTERIHNRAIMTRSKAMVRRHMVNPVRPAALAALAKATVAWVQL